MIELFKQAEAPGLGGFYIPVASDNSDLFFTERTVATREYQGILMRHTAEGWQFYTEFDKTWNDVYVKNSFFRQFIQVIQNKWRDRQSNFAYIQEFEDADSPFTEEYELGEYWLVRPDSPLKNWFLVPVNKAEQLSNVNELEIHSIGDTNAVFNALQQALSPLRDNVYGVIFTAENGKRARLRLTYFDWKAYDRETEQH